MTLETRHMLLISRQCPIDRGCSAWIFKYLKDCVCNTKDAVSFSFGLVSVISWGIAEVPQIVTNFREKSTEGVSLLFLMTWVIGDFFNLAGCLLEPATLPTQFYMALLYTVTTLVLVGQTLHYNRMRKLSEVAEAEKEPLIPEKQQRPPARHPEPTPAGVEGPATSMRGSTISVPSPQRRKFYMSARSLASSHTPTAGSFLSGSGRSAAAFLGSHPSLSNLQDAAAEHDLPRSDPRLVRAVATGILFVGGFSFHSSQFVFNGGVSSAPEFAAFGGRRRLLQDTEEHSKIGEMFGWAMATIYMGGRLPQIWLNITRGTVEGLNPMMFMFALIGNATYVASILIRSVEWERLKPNMPWLVDAAVCVLLDFFVSFFTSVGFRCDGFLSLQRSWRSFATTFSRRGGTAMMKSASDLFREGNKKEFRVQP